MAPNGRLVVFSAIANGRQQLFLRSPNRRRGDTDSIHSCALATILWRDGQPRREPNVRLAAPCKGLADVAFCCDHATTSRRGWKKSSTTWHRTELIAPSSTAR